MSNHRRRRLVLLTIAFEALLGLVGVGIAWLADLPMAKRLDWSSTVAGRAALATAPMLILLAIAMKSRWAPLAALREQVRAMVAELFGGAAAWQLALVAVAAGVGEELLFRGALQPLAERWVGATLGLGIVSLVFGALHAASAMYFFLATLVGAYLGWLAQFYDDMVTPMVVHAAYDFAALWVLVRTSPPAVDGFPSSEFLNGRRDFV